MASTAAKRQFLEDPAATALVWDGTDRFVRHNRVGADLDALPYFLEKDKIVGVRYYPGAGEFKVRVSSQAWQDMSVGQRALAQDFCERMARMCRSQLW